MGDADHRRAAGGDPGAFGVGIVLPGEAVAPLLLLAAAMLLGGLVLMTLAS